MGLSSVLNSERQRGALSAACVLAFACSGTKPANNREDSPLRGDTPLLSSADGIATALQAGQLYVNNREYRRQAMANSLIETDNGYARLRLKSYAQEEHWEQLPILNLPAAQYRVPSEPIGQLEPLNLQEFSWEHAEVLALGRKAFETWPIQRRASLEQDFARGSLLPGGLPGRPPAGAVERHGLWSDSRGALGGLVRVQYPDGTTGLSLSCSSCHSLPDDSGNLQYGLPSNIVVGGPATQSDAAWSVGAVDVTPDGTDNPVAIADLRVTRWQTRLHHTGNVGNSLVALAVRIESLLITSVANAARPPRKVSFALAYFLWNLGEQTAERAASSSQWSTPTTEGASLFAQDCASCHWRPQGAGDWISLSELDSNQAAANSSTRGTGGYRVPALLGLFDRRLGHQGLALNLEQWLVPNAETGHLGHPRQLNYSAAQLEQLAQYLRQEFALQERSL